MVRTWEKNSIFMSSDDNKTHACQNGSQKTCMKSNTHTKLFMLIFNNVCHIYDMKSGGKNNTEIAETLALFGRIGFGPSKQHGYLRFHLISRSILDLIFPTVNKKYYDLCQGFKVCLATGMMNFHEKGLFSYHPCRYVKDIFSMVSLV